MAHLDLKGGTCSLDHAIVSMYAVRSEDGSILMEKNAHLSLVPASCIKIVTTGAALQLLGADSRFETHLEYEGSIDRGVLYGNIYIRGEGDPCLGSDRISDNPSWEEQLRIWADAIQKLGIQKIRGKVLADVSKWEKGGAVPSWLWEDIGNYYGAGASALSFHENFYTLFFKPGAQVGEPAIILRTEPPMASLIFHNEVTTGPKGSGDGACIYGSEIGLQQVVRGTIPLGVEEFSIKGAIPNAAAFCASVLTEELRKRGIEMEECEEGQQGSRHRFYTSYSPPIKDIVFWTNQKSINLYAEHLLKKMGEVICGEGSTKAGIQAVTDFWQANGVDMEGFYMADGSGLSKNNMMTSKQLVEILLRIQKTDVFPDFILSLPQKDDGIRAKSGSMFSIKGCVGYKGKIVFAVVVNHCPSQRIMNGAIQDFMNQMP